MLEVLPFDRHFEERFAAREADIAIGDADSLRGYRHSEVLFIEHYLSLVRADHPRLNSDREITLDDLSLGIMLWYPAAGLDMPASSSLTQKWLDWNSTQIGLIEDIGQPGYSAS